MNGLSGVSVKVTPIFGGKNDLSNLCTLLSLGNDLNVLLDCGVSSTSALADYIHELGDIITKIDIIVLSHADLQHLGALAAIYRLLKTKSSTKKIPVLCTLPVHKFGQMVLYDSFLNQAMEGHDQAHNYYDLDDVDEAFEQVVDVKYCQQVSFDQIAPHLGHLQTSVSFCAYASGRSVGGSMWRIRYGHTDILYAMDVQLRRETVVSGAAIDLLPPSPPALMIVEGGSLAPPKKDREEYSKAINLAMQALREGGNVLIPCEPAGRTLEWLQVFARYWQDHRVGLYHLVFLAPLAPNILEYARSQLEWMNEALAAGFFSGRSNPFELPALHTFTNTRDMDRACPGQKVVFATESSLGSGLAKELLLRWGGDPRNRVFLVDPVPAASLAAELRAQKSSPPIVVSVTRPMKIELQVEELLAYKKEKERMKRTAEEARQRAALENELAMLNADREVDEEDEDAPGKRPRLDTRRFIEPKHPMFSCLPNTNPNPTEFGASLADLVFSDIAPSYLLGKRVSTAPNPVQPSSSGPTRIQPEREVEVPSKTVSTRSKVQFTCDFMDMSPQGNGRADVKAIKTLLARVNPSRVIVLRGAEAECMALAAFAAPLGLSLSAPLNRHTLHFHFQVDRVRLMVSDPGVIRAYASAPSLKTSTKICSIAGQLMESGSDSGRDGIRVVRLFTPGTLAAPPKVEPEVDEPAEDEGGEVEINGDAAQFLLPAPVEPNQVTEPEDEWSGPTRISGVGVGEVMLNSLKTILEGQHNISVEYRLSHEGGALVCGGQVLVRKDSDGGLLLEGPSSSLFFAVRRALYQQLAFI